LTGPSFALERGRYELPFSVTLPTGLPSSYEADDGSGSGVYYHLIAGAFRTPNLHSPLNHLECWRLFIPQGTRVPTPLSDWRPVTVQASKKAGLFGSGRTSASLTLPHVAFARGSEMPVDVVVENGAKRSVKKVVVKLTRLVYGVAADDPEEEELDTWQVQQGAAIRSSRPRRGSDAAHPEPATPTADEVALAGGEAASRASLSSTTISKFALVTKEILPGETATVTDRIRLPPGCTPSFSTEVLSLSYALKLVVYFGFGVANLEVLVPIKVLPTSEAGGDGDARDRTISSRELLQSGSSRKLAKSYNRTLSKLSLRSESFDLPRDDSDVRASRGSLGQASVGSGSGSGGGVSSTLTADDMAAMMRRAPREGDASPPARGSPANGDNEPLYDAVPRRPPSGNASPEPDEYAAFPSMPLTASAAGRYNTMPAGDIATVVASSLSRDSNGDAVITADQLRALLSLAPAAVAGLDSGAGSDDDAPPSPPNTSSTLPTPPSTANYAVPSEPPPLPPVPVDVVLDDISGDSSNAPPAPPSPR